MRESGLGLPAGGRMAGTPGAPASAAPPRSANLPHWDAATRRHTPRLTGLSHPSGSLSRAQGEETLLSPGRLFFGTLGGAPCHLASRKMRNNYWGTIHTFGKRPAREARLTKSTNLGRLLDDGDTCRPGPSTERRLARHTDAPTTPCFLQCWRGHVQRGRDVTAAVNFSACEPPRSYASRRSARRLRCA